MYIVEITNNGITTEIHGFGEKLKSGKITKGINTIDSFTFSIWPNNPGFNSINEFTTFVSVYNTNKDRYDFIGRVLYAETTMEEDGSIAKSVTCENVFGYLCDSCQSYVAEQNWTVLGLLQHLIDCHNSQTEEYKHFKIGTVTASDSNDNLYQGVQRENTWDSIKSKLIDKIGGEIQCRVEEDGIYIDYLEQIGEEKETAIALSVNMKSITKEQDPSAFITRLIPLGYKLKDDEGNDTEQRLDITSVNNELNYVEDAEAVAVYGIHVGVVEWDDVTEAENLLSKAKNWLETNNKVQVKYSITALDLSLLGLAVDDFDVGNTHPLDNALIDVDDSARIIKTNTDICEETKSTIEVGDNFKTLSDIQREQAQSVKNLENLEVEMNQKIETSNQTNVANINKLTSSVGLTFDETQGNEGSIVLSIGTEEHVANLKLFSSVDALKTGLNNGRLELYYNNVLAGTISAGTDGIRFARPDGTVDYLLNTGSDYSESNIFKTSSRFLADMTADASVYLAKSPTITSDRSAKNSIEELPDAYESFIDELRPVRFKLNNDGSGRYHVGYIAQDVAGALAGVGLAEQDFAGCSEIGTSGKLGLAYEEFIALLHMKINRLEQRVIDLERVVMKNE